MGQKVVSWRDVLHSEGVERPNASRAKNLVSLDVFGDHAQPATTYSKLTMETLEQDVNYV